jgi:SSU ribosomal protein S21P
MAIAEVAPNESIDSALRHFKRMVQREGIIADVKQHRFFMLPGENGGSSRSRAQAATFQPAWIGWH